MKQTNQSRLATTSLISGVTLFSALLIASCTPKKNSSAGFMLPPGDAMAGQTTFVALGCINCHTVDGVSFTESDEITLDRIIKLGGLQPRVKTYGQLVTGIIHPNAEILRNDARYLDADGQSLMPNYTQRMTIQQMTDIVTFLQEHYDVYVPAYDPPTIGYPDPYTYPAPYTYPYF